MLRAGFASADITPGTAISLLGYDFRQAELPPGNAGVLDPLAVRVLALDDGTARALWLTLDICIVSVAFARSLRRRLAERFGIAEAAILVGCSHTHSGPWLREQALSEDLAAVLPHCGDSDDDAAAAYVQELVVRCEETAARALGLTVPVEVRYRAAPLGLGYCRRVRRDDGVDLCWNPQEQAHLQPAASDDPTLSVLEFRQVGGSQRFVVFGHGSHPVTLGKTSRLVSADWPGRAIASLEEWYPGTQAMFALGACGDTHPWLATQADPAAVATVGRAAAAQVALLLESGGMPVVVEGLRCHQLTTTIDGTVVDLAAWRLGPCRLLASPTEMFAGLSAEIRRRLDGPVFQCTNTNGWTGYWPTAAAFAEGGYEVEAARHKGRTPAAADALVDALVELGAQLD